MLGGESSLREDDAAREDEDEDVVVVVRSSTRRAHAATLEGDDTLQPLGKRRRVDKPVETPVQQPMNTLVVNQVSGEEAEHETLAFNQEAMMDDGLSDDGMAACPEGLLETDPTDAADPVQRPLWDDVVVARSAIQSRLSGRDVQELVRLDDQYGTLSCAVERTVKERKSGSILLIGPRGSGKSSLVKQVLREATRAHSQPRQKAFFEIHLNGLIQTDDKIALREIVRQLHLENDMRAQKLNSFAECLAFILSALKNVSMAPVVFVVEELDLFAQHPKQSLLYNLFDLTQTSGSSLFVLGVTSKMDVMEYFEKRVKSRFSHQCLYFYPPDTLPNFIQTAKGCCLLTQNDGIRDTSYRINFNKSVEGLFKKVEVKAVAKRIFDLNRDMSAFSNLSEQAPYPCADDITRASSSFFVDHKAKLVSSLSVLEVCLFTAVKHILDRQGDEDAFNFEMVFDEYREFTKRVSTFGRSVNVFFTKPVAQKAFERLLELELVKYLDGHPGKGTKEHRMMKSMMTRVEIQDAVMEFARDLPDAVMKWAES